MLKLSLRPGEFIDIGENVRVIFSGGSANNIHLLVDLREKSILQEVQPGRKKTRQNRVQADTTRKVVFPMKHRKRL